MRTNGARAGTRLAMPPGRSPLKYRPTATKCSSVARRTFICRPYVGEETMMRITFQHPTVLGLSVEDNIRPTLRFLAESLHLDGRAVVNICRLHPPLLHLNVDTNLRPTVGWFCKRLDLSPVQLGQIVAKFPSMLGYSIELNLEPKVAFLTRALALRAGKATLGAGVALSRSHSDHSLRRRRRRSLRFQ